MHHIFNHCVVSVNPCCKYTAQIAIGKNTNGLLVTNESGVLVGAFNMHDLLKAKVV